MPVHRMTPLSEAENRGRLIVPYAVAVETRIALQGFRGPDGRHEGMIFWIGRRIDFDSFVCGSVIPTCEHRPQFVQAPAAAIGPVSRYARSMRLAVVAQVHSHPGDDTRHSDGDDSMILMPVEGMFSVVVGNYGDGGITLETGVGLHQFQKKRWVRIPSSCKEALSIVPTVAGGLG